MRQHILRVERPVIEFESLIAALRHDGRRSGWLELDPASTVPAELEAGASLGVLRAVAVGGGRSVAVKPMRGAPVLGDLLREHFRGCTLVLIRGDVEAPLLEPAGDGWSVRAGSAARRLSTEELVTVLRKARPWGDETRERR